MITRVALSGLLMVCTASVGAVGVAHAGKTSADPPIQVVPADAGMAPDDLPGPPPEIRMSVPKLALPAVPAFELPASEPGFHAPRALRVRGRAALGTELRVKGYVTWIYDCASALASANPRATRAQLLASIDADPSLCERPMFSLGDARTTAPSASIWVVDVPRAPSRPEREQLSRDQLAAWPKVPRLAVGDYVVVTGTWAIDSPHGERNTDGLLVYQAIEHVVPSAAPAPAPVASEPPALAIDLTPEVPLRRIIETRVRNASVERLNACNTALAARQYDLAITECRTATELWDDNHLAWYGAAGAHLGKAEWDQAARAIERAVALRPDQAMYQLYDGMARYEAERARAHPGRPTASAIEPAREALVRAIRLEPALWRAHFYLGRVYRDLEDARRAALHLTRALATNPGHRTSYIALIELYRRWGYLDQALAVALVGTANVAPEGVADLWFEVGMAYDAQHADDRALEALGKAIAARPDDASAKLQRAQIYLRKADFARARRDLGEVVASQDPRAGSARRLATQLLGQLALRDRAPTGSTRDERGVWKVVRPAQQPYKPWTLEDAKFRF